jgi:uncharacterized protein YkwD
MKSMPRCYQYLLFMLLCLTLPAVAQQTKPPDTTRVERAITGATNEFRRTHKQDRLDPNPLLEQTALEFARFMARTGKYGHNVDGRSPEQRAQQRGYDYCIVAENIAYLFSPKPLGADQLARQFVRGWENSPGHRRNMLNPDVTQIGVAVARSDKTNYFYAVQLFGRPKSAAISFQVENPTGDTVPYTLDGRSLTLTPGTTRTHQQCGLADLKLGATTVTPKNGERYAIVKENSGKYRLNRK